MEQGLRCLTIWKESEFAHRELPFEWRDWTAFFKRRGLPGGESSRTAAPSTCITSVREGIRQQKQQQQQQQHDKSHPPRPNPIEDRTQREGDKSISKSTDSVTQDPGSTMAAAMTDKQQALPGVEPGFRRGILVIGKETAAAPRVQRKTQAWADMTSGSEPDGKPGVQFGSEPGDGQR